MKKFLIGAICSLILFACSNEKKADTAETPANTTPSEKKGGDELLAMSDGEWAKTALTAFSKGDVDGFTANYDDNARFLWSGGDSLVGKKAIQDYYKGRWKLIDSLTFSENVVLPIKMNEQQSQYAPLGKWTLTWSLAHVKYKNGKKLDFWVHNVYHHNEAGKVDIIGQYIDRQPLLEATKGLMPK